MSNAQKPAMPRARDKEETRPEIPAPATPDNEHLAHMLAPFSEPLEGWKDRDPTSKAMRAAQGASERLGGLAEICWNLAFAEMSKRHDGYARALKSPYSYLARTLDDISAGLQQAHTLWWQKVSAEDEAKGRRNSRPARRAA